MMIDRAAHRLAAISLCVLLALGGCAGQDDHAESDAGPALETAGLFSDRDLAGSYDEGQAVAIRLTGGTAACDSAAVAIDGGTVTIAAEGVYLLSGTLTDGQIVVDAGDADKVQLVLAGADITSSSSAAIYARSADKVFLTLAQDTENTLANGGTYSAIDENNIDGVVFAKTDLTLNGAGSLTVTAQAGHGVVCKDDLAVTGGSYTVTAASHGLSGKDSIAIAGGSFAITAGKDGIHAENSDDLTLGTLTIVGGSFTIAAQGDAVSAQGALAIGGGTYQLTAGEGSESVEMTASQAFDPAAGRGGQMAGGRPEDRDAQAEGATAEEDTVSQKGIKGESTFAISGGDFTIDSADDCLHAGGAMVLAAGAFTLRSGDDAIHCDDALTIRSGSFTIPYCYEGIEGLSITIEDGIFDITSHDDGLNAAGGADSSGFGRWGQDAFTAGSDSFILLSGGSFTIVSGGDCVDSNGDLTINAGAVLDLTCNGAGDTALDCDGAYTNNGGDVTTNDGSEENPGQMGGGMGGRPGGIRPEGTEGDLAQGQPPQMPEDGLQAPPAAPPEGASAPPASPADG